MIAKLLLILGAGWACSILFFLFKFIQYVYYEKKLRERK